MQSTIKSRILLSVMAIGFFFSFNSCEKDNQKNDSVLTISEEVVTVSSTGGIAQASYTIENPAPGTVLDVQPQADWVNGIDTSTEGIIKFNVDENNEDKDRQTEVKVIYGNASDSFTVRQVQGPELTVTDKRIYVSYEMTETEARYTITNPEEGLTLEIEPEAEWISITDTSTDGVVKMKISRNEGNYRESKVTVRYGKLSDEFIVCQRADNEFTAFTIDLPEETLTATTAYFSVTPENKEMTYVSMAVTKEYFNTFSTPEEYICDDIEYFKKEAEKKNMSLENYLRANVLYKGDIGPEKLNLKEETEYVLYAYGLSDQAEILTGFHKYEFKTKAIEKSEVTFGLDYEIKGIVVNAKVTPSDKEILYYFTTADKAQYSDAASLKADIEKDIKQKIKWNEMFGFTAKDYVMDIASSGDQTFTLEKEANKEYIGFVCAIDTNGVFISEPMTKDFATGDPEPSDNIIDIKISNITTRTADIDITTTNNDPYIMGHDMASYWEGKSDEEIVQELINSYRLDDLKHNGNFSSTIKDLNPDTEYVIFSFGYAGGSATTDLIKIEFRTEALPKSDVTFRLIHDKYFDGTELESEYPDDFMFASGYAVLPVKVEALPADKVKGYRYAIMSGDLTETPDSEIVGFLLNKGSSTATNYFYSTFDVTLTLVGFAEDNDGAYGDLYKEVIVLAKDGVSPIEEFDFFEAAPAKNTVLSLPVKRHDNGSANAASLFEALRKTSPLKAADKSMPVSYPETKTSHPRISAR